MLEGGNSSKMRIDSGNRKNQILINSIISLGSIPLINYGCKGSTTPEPPPIPHPVTVRTTLFNHTKGVVRDKTYSGMSGSPLTIKVDDVYSPNTDTNRIAVREAANQGYLGKYVGFSRDGKVELVTRTNNLAGINTFTLICDSNGNLNEIGRDLFAYVYVKDRKKASSSSGFPIKWR